MAYGGLLVEVQGISAWIILIAMVSAIALPSIYSLHLQNKYEESLRLYKDNQAQMKLLLDQYEQDLRKWESDYSR